MSVPMMSTVELISLTGACSWPTAAMCASKAVDDEATIATLFDHLSRGSGGSALASLPELLATVLNMPHHIKSGLASRLHNQIVAASSLALDVPSAVCEAGVIEALNALRAATAPSTAINSADPSGVRFGHDLSCAARNQLLLALNAVGVDARSEPFDSFVTTPCTCCAVPVLEGDKNDTASTRQVLIPRTSEGKAYALLKHEKRCLFGAIVSGAVVHEEHGQFFARPEEEPVCIKLIEKKQCGGTMPDHLRNEDPRKEMACLQHLARAFAAEMQDGGIKGDPDRLVKLIDCYEDKEHYFIVMPQLFSDLFTEVVERNETRPLHEDVCRNLIKDIIDGLRALHGIGIVHHDLALENIMVSKEVGRNKQRAVIIDFGMAVKAASFRSGGRVHGVRLSAGKQWPAYCGRRAYLAPELLAMRGEKEDRSLYRGCSSSAHAAFDPFKIDVWAVGVCSFILLSGTSPWDVFKGPIKENIDFLKTDGTIRLLFENWGIHLSSGATDFVQKCLDPNPDTRWNVDDLSTHPWLIESEEAHLHGICGNISADRFTGDVSGYSTPLEMQESSDGEYFTDSSSEWSGSESSDHERKMARSDSSSPTKRRCKIDPA